MSNLALLRQQYEAVKAKGLKLNMQRGQPSDEDFDLSNPLLTALNAADFLTPSKVDIRNYPGGLNGIPEARQLFAPVLGVQPQELMVGNNSSLEMMSHVLMWAMLKGVKGSSRPWIYDKPKMIVTVPGYDRHFSLLETIGYEMVTVAMTPAGPDMDAVEQLAANDPAVKGIFFVPTYSNPTGDTISDENVRRLAGLKAAAADFTIFADDAYVVHHLTNQPDKPLNLLTACKEAGHPDRVFLFGSTSKITFAGAGIGFMGCSEANLAYMGQLIGMQTIGPNKAEQYRHWKFITQYPGGLEGLMQDHAKIIAPKFMAVYEVLDQELGGTGLASWTQPKGGYFISLDTTLPVASQVVSLANAAGVSLTPAGATYPHGRDPHNRNIRLAPTRPPVAEVLEAMSVVALCVKLASAEYKA